MPRRLEQHLPPLVAGLLLAAPVLLVPWPPSSDLALHEGMIGLLAGRGDPTFAPPGLYRLALGHTNQLLYLLAWPLARLTGPALACRLLLAATIVATLVAAGHLAAHLGKTRWAALAVAPVALGWSFYWGFVPQMLGFALFLALLPRLDRDARRGRPAAALSSSLAIAGLGLAHVSSMLCACVAVAVFTLALPLDRRTPPRLAPAAVGVCLALLEDRWDRAIATPLAQLLSSRVLWHPLGRKLGSVVTYLIGAHGAIAQAAVALLVLVAVVLWRTAAPRSPSVAPSPGPLAWLDRNRFAVLASLLFALYLAAPYSLNFGAFFYVRFLAPAFTLAVLVAAPGEGARGPGVVAPALALLLAPLAIALPQLAAATAQTRALEPLLGRIERGSSVAVIHLGKYDHALLFDPTSLGNRVLGERGGRELASFTEYPIAPVVIAPALRWDSIVLRTSARSGALQPATDLRRIAWVLVSLHDPGLAPLVARAFEPEARLEAASGEWMLFHSRLPQLPLTAPDAEPDASAETLQDRVTRALRGRAPP